MVDSLPRIFSRCANELTDLPHQRLIRLQHQPLRPILPPPRLILPPHDGEGVQDVGQFVASEAVEVGVEGVEFGAQLGAALLVPDEGRAGGRLTRRRRTGMDQRVSEPACPRPRPDLVQDVLGEELRVVDGAGQAKRATNSAAERIWIPSYSPSSSR